jgi:hypothetical protein
METYKLDKLVVPLQLVLLVKMVDTIQYLVLLKFVLVVVMDLGLLLVVQVRINFVV